MRRREEGQARGDQDEARVSFIPGWIKPETPAPLKLTVELWPARLKARATLTKDGKDRDVEVSSPIVAVLLGFLKPYLK